MKKNLLCIPVFCCVLILFFTLTGQAQKKKGPIPGDPEFNGILQAPGPKSDSKLSKDLNNLYESSQPGLKKAQSTNKPSLGYDALNDYMVIRGDKVAVDITVADDLNSAINELQKMGLQVTATFGRVISGLISISALPQLESAASVRYARPAYKPIHHTMMNRSMLAGAWNPPGPKVTPVISQGDTAQRSYIARKKYNVNGNGVKVGVISDSYNNLGTAKTGVLHGELPGPGNPFNFRKPVQVLKDQDSNGTDEGRAMAEIVHDVAPGAEIAFHTASGGQAVFAQGIVNLAKRGSDVIVDDVSYFAEPFFQDGIIAQAVNQVKKKGATYFSAAGNEGVNSYESIYRPTLVEPVGPGNGFAHNFSGPGTPPRYAQPIYIPPGGVLIASFQWDQPSFTASGVRCESDYDIYLSDIHGNIVAAGASDNIFSGDPIEVFGYFNSDPVNYTFFLTIVKFSGPDASRIKYLMYDDAQFFLTTNPIPGILSPSLVGHAKAEGAIATGAAWYLQTPAYGVDTPVVEFYSSKGGVADYFDVNGNRIAPLIRKKPE
ncbi:MAG TPA: hypothetical protein VE035_17990, partial [Puia sp.]|nr:hypothetical protein [Puia sp.]